MKDMNESNSIAFETGKYGFSIPLPWRYERAVERVTEALQSEGFGVLTEIDVRSTLKKKLDVDFPKYVILGACNPSLAYRALQVEPDLGLLLPCNVVVHEVEGGARVAFVDPVSILGVAANTALEPIADEVRARLERVARILKSEARE
jgi:uncharacterized protein (DUF302 family)